MSTYLFTQDYNETVVELAKRFGLYDAVVWTPVYLSGLDQTAPWFTGTEFSLSGNWRDTVAEANRLD